MITVHGVRISSNARSKPLAQRPVLSEVRKIVVAPRQGQLDELYLVPEDYARFLEELRELEEFCELRFSLFDVAAGVTIP